MSAFHQFQIFAPNVYEFSKNLNVKVWCRTGGCLIGIRDAGRSKKGPTGGWGLGSWGDRAGNPALALRRWSIIVGLNGFHRSLGITSGPAADRLSVSRFCVQSLLAPDKSLQ